MIFIASSGYGLSGSTEGESGWGKWRLGYLYEHDVWFINLLPNHRGESYECMCSE